MFVVEKGLAVISAICDMVMYNQFFQFRSKEFKIKIKLIHEEQRCRELSQHRLITLNLTDETIKKCKLNELNEHTAEGVYFVFSQIYKFTNL